MKKLLGILLSVAFLVTSGLNLSAQASSTSYTITELSIIDSGAGEGGAEIPTFHKESNRIFTTNGADNTIDIYDIATQKTQLWSKASTWMPTVMASPALQLESM